MNKLLLILVFAFKLGLNAQVCKALFSYSVNTDKVAFYNQSTVANAHYYWNFGDGTTSHFRNPIHLYPGNGKFLATLYVLDSINNCYDIHEAWLNINKYTTGQCLPVISDTIYPNPFNPYCDVIEIKDISHDNCTGVQQFHFNGGAGNGQSNTFCINKNFPANYLSYVSYAKSNGEQFVAAQTVPYNYDRKKSYGPCSANFEFSVVSDKNYGTMFFKAMNKNALKYKWGIVGFGNGIEFNTDTCRKQYFVMCANINPPWYCPSMPVYLYIEDKNGCKDSLIQNFWISPPNITSAGEYELENDNIASAIFPNPTSDKVQIKFSDGNADTKEIKLFDALGQKIIDLTSINHTINLDLSDISEGIYFLNLQTLSKSKTIKLIKQ